MGEKLDASFAEATRFLKKELPSQRGGTCGLYCLWYASLLLSTFNPGKPVVWPKRSEAPAEQRSGALSLRKYAKRVGSGQGELVNLGEIASIIVKFGYKYESIQGADEGKRAQFIRESLAAERPILFPYLEGGDPGKDCRPIPRKDNNCGAHWSLVFAEKGGNYVTLDPHWANTPREYSQSDMLKANAAADQKTEPLRFIKSETTGVKPGKVNKVYEAMSQPNRQQDLSYLLIAVY